jgi:DNA-3-methyladenine glycosylase I
MTHDSRKRCSWPLGDPIYLAYHDQEWGVPVFDDQKLFEMLILEGTQAGLSWITILKRREGYRKLYEQFDAAQMARWTDADLEEILLDPRIIRNRLKVFAARHNAQSFVKLQEAKGSFKEFIWSFVDHSPVVNEWVEFSQTPTMSKASDAMSRELKNWGFKFVGSTICYAYMQAVGMVNDHLVSCYRHQEVQRCSKV